MNAPASNWSGAARELLVIRKWAGTTWLEEGMKTHYVSFLGIGIAILLGKPGIFSRIKNRYYRLIGSIALTWGVFLIVSELTAIGYARVNGYGYSSWLFLTYLDLPPIFYLASAFGISLAGCVLTVKIAHEYSSGLAWLIFCVAVLAVLPFSLFTIKILPSLHNETDLVHAIKMGYHIMWGILLIGVASRLSYALYTRKIALGN